MEKMRTLKLKTKNKSSRRNLPEFRKEDTEVRHGSSSRALVVSPIVQPAEKVHKFAFVVHPLHCGFLKKHLKVLNKVPDKWVEHSAANLLSPSVLSKIVGGISPTTGQRIEGLLLTVFATPAVMMNKKPEFTYKQLVQASKMAHAYGAKIMGLGAFTSVVGDAGVSVSEQAPIAITTGNSLTVVASIETVHAGLAGMETTLEKAMVVGATGSIGAACSRYLAKQGYAVVLVAPRQHKLLELKEAIELEIPGAKIEINLSPDYHAPECQAIITTTSAFGQRVLDVSTLAPGAVVVDVARPCDISEEEAALRPDICVIESGEVYIPPAREVDIGYNIGLPRGVAYACLGETALLAMEGRFESFTLGRYLTVSKIEEIKDLYDKHGFTLSELRTPKGKVLDAAVFAEKRLLANVLREDSTLFSKLRWDAQNAMLRMPPSAKGAKETKIRMGSRRSFRNSRRSGSSLKAFDEPKERRETDLLAYIESTTRSDSNM